MYHHTWPTANKLSRKITCWNRGLVAGFACYFMVLSKLAYHCVCCKNLSNLWRQSQLPICCLQWKQSRQLFHVTPNIYRSSLLKNIAWWKIYSISQNNYFNPPFNIINCIHDLLSRWEFGLTAIAFWVSLSATPRVGCERVTNLQLKQHIYAA